VLQAPASNEPRQPVVMTIPSKENGHDVHQVIIPLEALYKMQAQERLKVPDDSNYDSRQRNVVTEDRVALPQGGLIAPNMGMFWLMFSPVHLTLND
jgi:hypothetical protein